MTIETIQISSNIKSELDSLKLKGETYNEVISGLLEGKEVDFVDEKTLRDIEEAREEYKRGETISHEELKRELGL
jgi:uncharacterized coiled-coil DUF342 family protein